MLRAIAIAVVIGSLTSCTLDRMWCYDANGMCWGPYAQEHGRFFLEVRGESFRAMGCTTAECPKLLALAEEGVKARGWCPQGHTWDRPVWDHGILGLSGRCGAKSGQ